MTTVHNTAPRSRQARAAQAPGPQSRQADSRVGKAKTAILGLGVLALACKGTTTGLDLPTMMLAAVACCAMVLLILEAWRRNGGVLVPPVAYLAAVTLGYLSLRSAGEAVSYQLALLCFVSFLFGVISNQVSLGLIFRILLPIAWFFAGTATILSLLGFDGFFSGDDALAITRYSGLSANPNGFVAAMALFTPLALAPIALMRPTRALVLVLSWLLISVPVVTASGSAQGLPALGVAVGLSIWKMRVHPLGRVALIASLYLVSAPFFLSSSTFEKLTREVTDDFSGRFEIWSAASQTAQGSPFTGTGSAYVTDYVFGVFARSAHSGYLTILLIGGLMAIALVVALAVTTYKSSNPILLLVITPFLVTLAVVNIANVTIFLPLVWLVLGAGIAPNTSQTAPGASPYLRHSSRNAERASSPTTDSGGGGIGQVS